jgi:hypothetical protein
MMRSEFSIISYALRLTDLPIATSGRWAMVSEKRPPSLNLPWGHLDRELHWRFDLLAQ